MPTTQPTQTITTQIAESAENVVALAVAAALPVMVPTWPHDYSLYIALSAIGVPGALSLLGKRRGAITAAVGMLAAALPWLAKAKHLT